MAGQQRVGRASNQRDGHAEPEGEVRGQVDGERTHLSMEGLVSIGIWCGTSRAVLQHPQGLRLPDGRAYKRNQFDFFNQDVRTNVLALARAFGSKESEVHNVQLGVDQAALRADRAILDGLGQRDVNRLRASRLEFIPPLGDSLDGTGIAIQNRVQPAQIGRILQINHDLL